MAVFAPFEGRKGANQNVSPGAASASISIDPAAKSVRLVNTGTTNVCHVRIGKGAQTATTADLILRANSDLVVSKGEGEDTLAYISAAGTTLSVQTGEGGI